MQLALTPPKRCRRDLGRDPATSGNLIVANFSEIYRDILADHRKWLAGFGKHAAQWERRLRIQPEAAIVEEARAEHLAGYVKSVEPAEDSASGGPDFRCRRGGRIFYVESTCLTIDAVTNATKLSPSATGQAANYGTLTDLVKRECTNKTAQLSSRKDAPGLLAIGTLHFQASAQCIAERHVEAILTSTPFIACDFDPAAGEAVDDPYQAVNLRNSAFVKPPLADSIDAFEHARQSISGVLICGFGCIPPRILAHYILTRLVHSIPICFLKLASVVSNMMRLQAENSRPNGSGEIVICIGAWTCQAGGNPNFAASLSAVIFLIFMSNFIAKKLDTFGFSRYLPRNASSSNFISPA